MNRKQRIKNAQTATELFVKVHGHLMRTLQVFINHTLHEANTATQSTPVTLGQMRGIGELLQFRLSNVLVPRTCLTYRKLVITVIRTFNGFSGSIQCINAPKQIANVTISENSVMKVVI